MYIVLYDVSFNAKNGIKLKIRCTNAHVECALYEHSCTMYTSNFRPLLISSMILFNIIVTGYK